MRVENLPTFHTTVTVYRKTEKTDSDGRKHISYMRTVHKNCFWNVRRAESLDGNTVKSASVYLCRLPIADIRPGDVIFKGVVSETVLDEAGKRINDLIQKKKPDCFTVQTVSKNDAVSVLAHTKAEGV